MSNLSINLKVILSMLSDKNIRIVRERHVVRVYKNDKIFKQDLVIPMRIDIRDIHDLHKDGFIKLININEETIEYRLTDKPFS